PGASVRAVREARPRHAAHERDRAGRLRARARPRRRSGGARGAASRRPTLQHAAARAGHGSHRGAPALLPLASPRSAHRGPGGGRQGRRHREPHSGPVRPGSPAGLKARVHEVVRPPREERALLVSHAALDRDGERTGSLDELELLADTAGARVSDRIVQRRGTVHPGTFIGKGKLAEVKSKAEGDDVDVVIFDDDLSPAQVRNLEKELARKVIDRSELILDIFARRARTRESRLQVELAQLEYALPRL